jgi:hypothetical protein
MDPPPVVFPDAVRASDRQRNKSRSQVQRFGNITPRSKARAIKRLLTPIVEPPPVQFWVALTENKGKWEKFVEDTLTIARLATLIQKRSRGVTCRRQALLEAREQILAKSMRAGAVAAERILRQERAALEILTCACDACNERVTMRCQWCHEVPYCSPKYRNLNFEVHGVECRVDEAGDVQVPSTIGVLQGSNLSTTWFIVFMQAVMEVTQRKMNCVKPVFSTKKDGVIFRRRFDTGKQLGVR